MSSTFCVMLHTHQGGCAHHSHHLGLISLLPPSTNALPASDCRVCFHAHIVFMGVELWSLPTREDSETGAPHHGTFQVDVGWPGTSEDAASAAHMQDVPLLGAFPLVVPALFVMPDRVCSPVTASPRVRSTLPVCAQAAHARSGVALI
ncbi:MAG: hypothetical protein LC104_18650 [Bacteroidales bacterium]|nr:hypothetical protein [Bacteroidales bacterium]